MHPDPVSRLANAQIISVCQCRAMEKMSSIFIFLGPRHVNDTLLKRLRRRTEKFGCLTWLHWSPTNRLPTINILDEEQSNEQVLCILI